MNQLAFKDPGTGNEVVLRASGDRHALVLDRGVSAVHEYAVLSGNDNELESNHTHIRSKINLPGTHVDLGLLQLFHYLQDGTRGMITNKPGTAMFGVQGIRSNKTVIAAGLPSGTNIHEPEREGTHVLRGEIETGGMVSSVMVGPMNRVAEKGAWIGFGNVAIGVNEEGQVKIIFTNADGVKRERVLLFEDPKPPQSDADSSPADEG